jgi:hypothetical protein
VYLEKSLQSINGTLPLQGYLPVYIIIFSELRGLYSLEWEDNCELYTGKNMESGGTAWEVAGSQFSYRNRGNPINR